MRDPGAISPRSSPPTGFRSLAARTDLSFPAFEGEIIDRGEYWVVRTPSIPTFYWGNFLMFRDPPRPGDQARWPELFADEIGRPPEVNHQTFGWDSPQGELGSAQSFVPLGFTIVQDSVLATTSPHPPPRPAEGLDVRPLQTDDEWSLAFENQVLCRDPVHDESGYRTFKLAEMGRYRRMAEAGLGAWYGAFREGRLAADLGIYRTGEIGRYQNVGTAPGFRRRGIAATLVYQAGIQSMLSLGIETLVIVAGAESPADRLYRSVGFQPVERQAGLERW